MAEPGLCRSRWWLNIIRLLWQGPCVREGCGVGLSLHQGSLSLSPCLWRTSSLFSLHILICAPHTAPHRPPSPPLLPQLNHVTVDTEGHLLLAASHAEWSSGVRRSLNYNYAGRVLPGSPRKQAAVYGPAPYHAVMQLHFIIRVQVFDIFCPPAKIHFLNLAQSSCIVHCCHYR